MSNSQGRTRREIFIDTAKAAAGAAAAGLAGCFPSVGGKWPDAGPDAATCDPDAGTLQPSKPVTPAVIEVLREDSIVAGTRSTIDPAVVAQMVDAGLAALAKEAQLFAAGQSGDPVTASDQQGEVIDNPWPALLPAYQPGQRIGIKVNCLGSVAPTPAFVRALIANLRGKLAIDPSNLLVWDRFLEDITLRGKYTAEDLAGATTCGNLLRGPETSKDETEDTAELVAGHGYGEPVCGAPMGIDATTEAATQLPRLSRVLTHDTALTINTLSFKSHNISGITGAIKSVYGIVHNPGEYHKRFNEVAPLLYAIPAVRNAIPLTICDGIAGLSYGDPTKASNCFPKRILLAQDPVAMDSYILDAINELRSGNSVPVPTDQLGWLDKAAALGLGTRNYKLVKVS